MLLVRNIRAAIALPKPIQTRLSLRSASTDPGKDAANHNDDMKEKSAKEEIKQPKKTMAELDEELRMKLEGRSGEGGAAGLELEGGKPVAMKRGVRENMFRLI